MGKLGWVSSCRWVVTAMSLVRPVSVVAFAGQSVHEHTHTHTHPPPACIFPVVLHQPALAAAVSLAAALWFRRHAVSTRHAAVVAARAKRRSEGKQVRAGERHSARCDKSARHKERQRAVSARKHLWQPAPPKRKETIATTSGSGSGSGSGAGPMTGTAGETMSTGEGEPGCTACARRQ